MVPQWVKTDGGKLRQVLINLVANSIKFTHQGSVHLKVKCFNHNGKEVNDLDEKNVWLHFFVVDTGPGIAPQEMDKIFIPFAQTEAGLKSRQGSGLGLPISQKFVQLMGGEIQVRSRVNRGSMFYFSIPVEIVSITSSTLEEQREVMFNESPPALLCLPPDVLARKLEKTPQPWRRKMAKMALECNDDALLDLIESLPTLPPSLVQLLTTWAKEYQFEQLFAFLEASLSQPQPNA
jgi:hypothetical protein